MQYFLLMSDLFTAISDAETGQQASRQQGISIICVAKKCYRVLGIFKRYMTHLVWHCPKISLVIVINTVVSLHKLVN